MKVAKIKAVQFLANIQIEPVPTNDNILSLKNCILLFVSKTRVGEKKYIKMIKMYKRLFIVVYSRPYPKKKYLKSNS